MTRASDDAAAAIARHALRPPSTGLTDTPSAIYLSRPPPARHGPARFRIMARHGTALHVGIRPAHARIGDSHRRGGSSYLYGFMDANYRENMGKEECVELVKQCVTLAINRDGSSGGCCRIAIITKDGIERRLFHNDRLPYFGELANMPSLKA